MRTPSTIARAFATATCRAVWEKPQSGVTETRRSVHVLQHRAEPLGHQLRRLDPGVLHVDQPDRHVHRVGQLRRASSTSAISRLANSSAS